METGELDLKNTNTQPEKDGSEMIFVRNPTLIFPEMPFDRAKILYQKIFSRLTGFEEGNLNSNQTAALSALIQYFPFPEAIFLKTKQEVYKRNPNKEGINSKVEAKLLGYDEFLPDFPINANSEPSLKEAKIYEQLKYAAGLVERDICNGIIIGVQELNNIELDILFLMRCFPGEVDLHVAYLNMTYRTNSNRRFSKKELEAYNTFLNLFKENSNNLFDIEAILDDYRLKTGLRVQLITPDEISLSLKEMQNIRSQSAIMTKMRRVMGLLYHTSKDKLYPTDQQFLNGLEDKELLDYESALPQMVPKPKSEFHIPFVLEGNSMRRRLEGI